MKSVLLAVAFCVLPRLAPAQAHHVSEREPNETLALATRIALDDSVSGEISDREDIDFFVFDLPASITLRMVRPVGNVWFIFYDTDGVTRLSALSPAWTADHPDSSHFAYPITRSGTYYVRVVRASPEADVYITGPYAMQLWAEPLTTGPGDPPKSLADIPELSSGAAVEMVGGPAGDVFVALHDDGISWPVVKLRILRIGPGGERSWITPDLRWSGGFALDAFGDLLVSGAEAGDSTNHIWRVHPGDGTKEKIVTDLGLFRYASDHGDGFHIAVAPNGDFWAGQVVVLRHYDAIGRLLDTVPLPRTALAAYSLAISPAGVVHYGYAYHGTYRINADRSVAFVTDTAGDLAFDRDGNLYIGVSSNSWGHVIQYDPEYHFVRRVANVPYLNGVLFPRDAQGELTSRLLTIQGGFIHDLVALADGAARAPGSGVLVRLTHGDLATIEAGTQGVAYRDTLTIAGVGDPLSWSLASGMLPRGVTLSEDGVLTGIPSDRGVFALSVAATNGTKTWYAGGTLEVRSLILSERQITDALLGGPPLSPQLADYLDRNGNANGQLDVGDLRAWLRAQGKLRSPR
jgi:hypothetical protein